MGRKEIFLNEDRDRRNGKRVLIVLFAVSMLVAAVLSWQHTVESEYSRGYEIGFGQACDMVRTTVASRMYASRPRPFIIADLGMSFRPVGDGTFTIQFYEMTDALPGETTARADETGR